MKLFIFILLACFIVLPGCSQCKQVTTTYNAAHYGQGIYQKVDAQQRQKEYQLFLQRYQEAAGRGNTESCRKLKEDYEERLRQYEIMDRVDQMDTNKGSLEHREDSTILRVDALGSVKTIRGKI